MKTTSTNENTKIDDEVDSRETASLVTLATSLVSFAFDGDLLHSQSQTPTQSQGGHSDASQSDTGQTNTLLSNIQYAMLTQPGLMWNDLNRQMDSVESQISGDLLVVGFAGAATSSLTVGLLTVVLRSGLLASGFLAQMPAWKSLDPLLVMQGLGESGDEESLQELIDQRIATLDAQDQSETIKQETP